MIDLQISNLLAGYSNGTLQVGEVIDHVLKQIDSAEERHVWITRLSREQVMSYVQALEQRLPNDLPLYGIPFAIKDNIDLANVQTTAGSEAYAYTPTHSATVVEKLIAAGAIPIGKTNLDQFATGLVGVRSPYGACRNSFDPKFISGGSSSGSAVAVASGLVSFALGTDTAGSGRVPAAFNNIVGLKPSCGLLSTRGVVPACRSLDAVSIFALSAADAECVLNVAEGFDESDPFSRQIDKTKDVPSASFRFGVPRPDQLEFFGDDEYRALFDRSVARLTDLGGVAVTIDFAPFLETARLLYEGPWVAERYAAIASFIEQQPESLHPVTLKIIGAGADLKAIDAFRAQYNLKELQRKTAAVWRDIDVLITPTAGTIYRIDEVEAEPIRLNSNLGCYTNFVNLLDFSGVAIPAGFRRDGLPFGVTLVAPAGCDRALLHLGAKLHHASVKTLGALDVPVPAPTQTTTFKSDIRVVVCGAHLSGLPLNHQLTDRGATLVEATQTASKYRFYALPGGPPKRPGLVRVPSGGAAIAVEVWSVPHDQFGSFVAGIPAPLGIGKVELADGSQCSGFICEGYGVNGAEDITHLGSWREYVKGR